MHILAPSLTERTDSVTPMPYYLLGLDKACSTDGRTSDCNLPACKDKQKVGLLCLPSFNAATT